MVFLTCLVLMNALSLTYIYIISLWLADAKIQPSNLSMTMIEIGKKDRTNTNPDLGPLSLYCFYFVSWFILSESRLGKMTKVSQTYWNIITSPIIVWASTYFTRSIESNPIIVRFHPRNFKQYKVILPSVLYYLLDWC